MGLVALVVVTTPVAFWIWSEAERHALENSKEATDHLANNVVGPLLDKEVLSGEPTAVERLDERLRPWMGETSVFEIRLWDKRRAHRLLGGPQAHRPNLRPAARGAGNPGRRGRPRKPGDAEGRGQHAQRRKR